MFVVFGSFEEFEAIWLSLYLLCLVLMFYVIYMVYSVFIVWTVSRVLGQLNKWLCCSLEFVRFSKFGAFVGVTCFISVGNIT